MKNRLLSFFLCLCLGIIGIAGIALADNAAPPATPLPPSVTPRNLLACADEDHFWVARVVPPGKGDAGFEQTRLLYRNRWGGAWTGMPSLSSRVVSIASQSGELLVVLENGQWMIGDESELRLGPPPPNNGKVVAIANEQNLVWAIVSDEGPTTQPTTESTTTPTTASTDAATQPSIGPIPHRWLVYRLDSGQWTQPHPLPPFAGDEPAMLSMTIVNQLPAIAWRAEDGSILISRLTDKGDWSKAAQVKTDSADEDFRLLALQGRSVLWTAATSRPSIAPSAGTLRFGDDFAPPIHLQILGKAPAQAEQTLALAFDHWRWLGATEDQLYEESYDLKGQPNAEVSAVGDEKPVVISLQPFVSGGLLVVAVAVVSAISLRRSRPNVAIPPEEVNARLAPPGLRVAAGLVDLIPFIAAISALPRGLPQAMVDRLSVQNILVVAVVVYVAHTMLAEIICGRSIGKMMFGLRVVDHDGKIPTRANLIVRNLLRIVDICLIVSLMIMFISPLRQRVGDLAGGTVVIVDEGETKATNEK